MTVEELQSSLIEQLRVRINSGNLSNDGSLVMQCDENIRWAWDNWDAETLTWFYDDFSEKPELYTFSFAKHWIENEPFENELESINNVE